MSQFDLEYFLRQLDQLVLEQLEEGASPNLIAGALLARVEHYYLLTDPSDLAGLERLLHHALSIIESRPKWDI